MQESFTTNIYGQAFEFSRITYSAFDVWYHVVARLKTGDVSYRMKRDTNGTWKIMTTRMKRFVDQFEKASKDAIELNEGFGKPGE